MNRYSDLLSFAVPLGDVGGDGLDEMLFIGRWPSGFESPSARTLGAQCTAPTGRIAVIDGHSAVNVNPNIVSQTCAQLDEIRAVFRVLTELEGRSLILLEGELSEHARTATAFDTTRRAGGSLDELADRTAHQLCEVRGDAIRCLPPVYYDPSPRLRSLDVLTCLTGLRGDRCGPWRPALLQRGAIR